MGVWGTVTPLEDGANVEASTFNKPLNQLIERTAYLNDRISAIVGNGQLSSVRFQARLSSSSNGAPDVGDIVCLDPDTSTFVKARSDMSVFDPYTATNLAYAVGILVSKQTDDIGVVATCGMVDLSGFDAPSMLEEGESPASGPYYVSSRESGKITAFPKGPRIQVGVFSINPQKNGRDVWDYAVVWPQYGDLLSHRHRTYRLSAKPAGSLVQKSPPSSGALETVEVFGYRSDALRSGAEIGDDDVVPFLRLSGEWPGRDPVTYTIWLASSDGGSIDDSSPPSSDFSDVFLYWSSSDAGEGSGRERVQSFYRPVTIGSKGLKAELDAGFSDDLSTPYFKSDDTVGFRTWTVKMPDYAKGWSANTVEDEASIGNGLVMAYGVPERRTDETHVFVPDKVFELPSTLPGLGDILKVDQTTYQFIDHETDESELDEGVVGVVIEGTSYATYRNIAHPLDDSGTAIVVGSSRAYVGASSVSYNGEELSWTKVGGGRVSESSGPLVVMVCDDSGISLVDQGFLVFKAQRRAIPLNNGCRISIRSASTGDVNLSPGDKVVLNTFSGCPGARFRYNIEMDEAFNSVYPPVPAKSGSLMWNGIELESDQFFDREATYSIGPDSLYWYSDVADKVPWPPEFTDPDETLDVTRAQRLVFHYVSSFHSETGPVVSLRPAPGSPITVRRCATTENATVGDLELDVDLLAQVFNSNEKGYKAVKASSHGKLLLGPMVEKIVAGPGIELRQAAGQPEGQGTVTIAATNASYSGEMETIALENAKQEIIGMFPYIRLLGWSEESSQNIPTGFVAKFQIPTSIADDVYRVKLYATVFGEESFVGENQRMAGITMSYNILPNWLPISGFGIETASLNLKSDLIAPDSPVSVDIPFGIGESGSAGTSFSYKAFDPILLHNDPTIENIDGRSSNALGNPIPTELECSSYLSLHTIGTSTFGVRPGYIVAVKFSRSAPSGGTPYTGKIGFINLRWALVDADSDESIVYKDTDIDTKQMLINLRKAAMRINTGNTSTSYQLREQFLHLINQLR